MEKIMKKNCKSAWIGMGVALTYAFAVTALWALVTTFIWNNWLTSIIDLPKLAFWKVEIFYFATALVKGCGVAIKKFIEKK